MTTDVLTGTISPSGLHFVPEPGTPVIPLEPHCARQRGKRVRRNGTVRRRFVWSFVDSDGYRWRGVNDGPGLPVVMRRVRQRRAVAA